jgi:hypothetical protein
MEFLQRVISAFLLLIIGTQLEDFELADGVKKI